MCRRGFCRCAGQPNDAVQPAWHQYRREPELGHCGGTGGDHGGLYGAADPWRFIKAKGLVR